MTPEKPPGAASPTPLTQRGERNSPYSLRRICFIMWPKLIDRYMDCQSLSSGCFGLGWLLLDLWLLCCKFMFRHKKITYFRIILLLYSLVLIFCSFITFSVRKLKGNFSLCEDCAHFYWSFLSSCFRFSLSYLGSQSSTAVLICVLSV